MGGLFTRARGERQGPSPPHAQGSVIALRNEALRTIGVDYAQGFAIAAPQPFDATTRMAARAPAAGRDDALWTELSLQLRRKAG